MRVRRTFKTVLTGMALTSIVASSSQLFGDEIVPSVRSTADDNLKTLHSEINDQFRFKHLAPTIADIVLDKHSNFHGTIVDSAGQPQSGILIVARQGDEHSRTAQTDRRGRFRLRRMKSGNWNVTVGQEVTWVRAWSAGVAPPAAKSNFLVVSKTPIVRGQSAVRGQSPDNSLMAAFDTGTLFSVGAGVAGVTLGIIGISDASEANDQADAAQASANVANDEAAALRAELNALGGTVNTQSLTLDTQSTQLNVISASLDEIIRTLN